MTINIHHHLIAILAATVTAQGMESNGSEPELSHTNPQKLHSNRDSSFERLKKSHDSIFNIAQWLPITDMKKLTCLSKDFHKKLSPAKIIYIINNRNTNDISPEDMIRKLKNMKDDLDVRKKFIDLMKKNGPRTRFTSLKTTEDEMFEKNIHIGALLDQMRFSFTRHLERQKDHYNLSITIGSNTMDALSKKKFLEHVAPFRKSTTDQNQDIVGIQEVETERSNFSIFNTRKPYDHSQKEWVSITYCVNKNI